MINCKTDDDLQLMNIISSPSNDETRHDKTSKKIVQRTNGGQLLGRGLSRSSRNRLQLLKIKSDHVSSISINIVNSILRYIRCTLPRTKHTPIFLEGVRNRLLFLYDYKYKLLQDKKKFPYTPQLTALLSQYVILEYEVLYSSRTYNIKYETEVERRILCLLEYLLHDPFKDNTDRFTATARALHVLKLIDGSYKDNDKLIDNMIKKLLNKMGLLDKLERLANNNSSETTNKKDRELLRSGKIYDDVSYDEYHDVDRLVMQSFESNRQCFNDHMLVEERFLMPKPIKIKDEDDDDDANQILTFEITDDSIKQYMAKDVPSARKQQQQQLLQDSENKFENDSNFETKKDVKDLFLNYDDFSSNITNMNTNVQYYETYFQEMLNDNTFLGRNNNFEKRCNNRRMRDSQRRLSSNCLIDNNYDSIINVQPKKERNKNDSYNILNSESLIISDSDDDVVEIVDDNKETTQKQLETISLISIDENKEATQKQLETISLISIDENKETTQLETIPSIRIEENPLIRIDENKETTQKQSETIPSIRIDENPLIRIDENKETTQKQLETVPLIRIDENKETTQKQSETIPLIRTDENKETTQKQLETTPLIRVDDNKETTQKQSDIIPWIRIDDNRETTQKQLETIPSIRIAENKETTQKQSDIMPLMRTDENKETTQKQFGTISLIKLDQLLIPGVNSIENKTNSVIISDEEEHLLLHDDIIDVPTVDVVNEELLLLDNAETNDENRFQVSDNCRIVVKPETVDNNQQSVEYSKKEQGRRKSVIVEINDESEQIVNERYIPDKEISETQQKVVEDDKSIELIQPSENKLEINDKLPISSIEETQETAEQSEQSKLDVTSKTIDDSNLILSDLNAANVVDIPDFKAASEVDKSSEINSCEKEITRDFVVHIPNLEEVPIQTEESVDVIPEIEQAVCNYEISPEVSYDVIDQNNQNNQILMQPETIATCLDIPVKNVSDNDSIDHHSEIGEIASEVVSAEIVTEIVGCNEEEPLGLKINISENNQEVHQLPAVDSNIESSKTDASKIDETSIEIVHSDELICQSPSQEIVIEADKSFSVTVPTSENVQILDQPEIDGKHVEIAEDIVYDDNSSYNLIIAEQQSVEELNQSTEIETNDANIVYDIPVERTETILNAGEYLNDEYVDEKHKFNKALQDFPPFLELVNTAVLQKKIKVKPSKKQSKQEEPKGVKKRRRRKTKFTLTKKRESKTIISDEKKKGTNTKKSRILTAKSKRVTRNNKIAIIDQSQQPQQTDLFKIQSNLEVKIGEPQIFKSQQYEELITMTSDDSNDGKLIIDESVTSEKETERKDEEEEETIAITISIPEEVQYCKTETLNLLECVETFNADENSYDEIPLLSRLTTHKLMEKKNKNKISVSKIDVIEPIIAETEEIPKEDDENLLNNANKIDLQDGSVKSDEFIPILTKEPIKTKAAVKSYETEITTKECSIRIERTPDDVIFNIINKNSTIISAEGDSDGKKEQTIIDNNQQQILTASSKDERDLINSSKHEIEKEETQESNTLSSPNLDKEIIINKIEKSSKQEETLTNNEINEDTSLTATNVDNPTNIVQKIETNVEERKEAKINNLFKEFISKNDRKTETKKKYDVNDFFNEFIAKKDVTTGLNKTQNKERLLKTSLKQTTQQMKQRKEPKTIDFFTEFITKKKEEKDENVKKEKEIERDKIITKETTPFTVLPSCSVSSASSSPSPSIVSSSSSCSSTFSSSSYESKRYNRHNRPDFFKDYCNNNKSRRNNKNITNEDNSSSTESSDETYGKKVVEEKTKVTNNIEEVFLNFSNKKTDQNIAKIDDLQVTTKAPHVRDECQAKEKNETEKEIVTITKENDAPEEIVTNKIEISEGSTEKAKEVTEKIVNSKGIENEIDGTTLTKKLKKLEEEKAKEMAVKKIENLEEIVMKKIEKTKKNCKDLQKTSKNVEKIEITKVEKLKNLTKKNEKPKIFENLKEIVVEKYETPKKIGKLSKKSKNENLEAFTTSKIETFPRKAEKFSKEKFEKIVTQNIEISPKKMNTSKIIETCKETIPNKIEKFSPKSKSLAKVLENSPEIVSDKTFKETASKKIEKVSRKSKNVAKVIENAKEIVNDKSDTFTKMAPKKNEKVSRKSKSVVKIENLEEIVPKEPTPKKIERHWKKLKNLPKAIENCEEILIDKSETLEMTSKKIETPSNKSKNVAKASEKFDEIGIHKEPSPMKIEKSTKKSKNNEKQIQNSEAIVIEMPKEPSPKKIERHSKKSKNVAKVIENFEEIVTDKIEMSKGTETKKCEKPSKKSKNIEKQIQNSEEIVIEKIKTPKVKEFDTSEERTITKMEKSSKKYKKSFAKEVKNKAEILTDVIAMPKEIVKIISTNENVEDKIEKSSNVSKNVEKPEEIVTTKTGQSEEIVTSKTEKPKESVISRTEIPEKIVISKTEIREEIVTSKIEIPQEIVTSKIEKPEEIVTSKTEKPKEIVTSKTEKPEEIVTSKTEKPKEIVTSKIEKPKEIVTSKTEKPEEIVTSKTEKPKGSVISRTEIPEEIVTSKSEKPKEIVTSKTEKPKKIVTFKTDKPEKIVTSKTEKPEKIATSKTEKPEDIVIPKIEKSKEVVSKKVKQTKDIEKLTENVTKKTNKLEEITIKQIEKPQAIVTHKMEKPNQVEISYTEHLMEETDKDGKSVNLEKSTENLQKNENMQLGASKIMVEDLKITKDVETSKKCEKLEGEEKLLTKEPNPQQTEENEDFPKPNVDKHPKMIDMELKCAENDVKNIDDVKPNELKNIEESTKKESDKTIQDLNTSNSKKRKRNTEMDKEPTVTKSKQNDNKNENITKRRQKSKPKKSIDFIVNNLKKKEDGLSDESKKKATTIENLSTTTNQQPIITETINTKSDEDIIDLRKRIDEDQIVPRDNANQSILDVANEVQKENLDDKLESVRAEIKGVHHEIVRDSIDQDVIDKNLTKKSVQDTVINNANEFCAQVEIIVQDQTCEMEATETIKKFAEPRIHKQQENVCKVSENILRIDEGNSENHEVVNSENHEVVNSEKETFNTEEKSEIDEPSKKHEENVKNSEITVHQENVCENEVIMQDDMICENQDVISENQEAICENQKVIGENQEVICENSEAICENQEVICENQEVICENQEVICENHEVICENHEDICENHEDICESQEDICENQEVICEHPEVISENHEVICQNREVIGENQEAICEHHEVICENPEVICENPEVITENMSLSENQAPNKEICRNLEKIDEIQKKPDKNEELSKNMEQVCENQAKMLENQEFKDVQGCSEYQESICKNQEESTPILDDNPEVFTKTKNITKISSGIDNAENIANFIVSTQQKETEEAICINEVPHKSLNNIQQLDKQKSIVECENTEISNKATSRKDDKQKENDKIEENSKYFAKQSQIFINNEINYTNEIVIKTTSCEIIRNIPPFKASSSFEKTTMDLIHNIQNNVKNKVIVTSNSDFLINFPTTTTNTTTTVKPNEEVLEKDEIPEEEIITSGQVFNFLDAHYEEVVTMVKTNDYLQEQQMHQTNEDNQSLNFVLPNSLELMPQPMSFLKIDNINVVNDDMQKTASSSDLGENGEKKKFRYIVRLDSGSTDHNYYGPGDPLVGGKCENNLKETITSTCNTENIFPCMSTLMDGNVVEVSDSLDDSHVDAPNDYEFNETDSQLNFTFINDNLNQTDDPIITIDENTPDSISLPFPVPHNLKQEIEDDYNDQDWPTINDSIMQFIPEDKVGDKTTEVTNNDNNFVTCEPRSFPLTNFGITDIENINFSLSSENNITFTNVSNEPTVVPTPIGHKTPSNLVGDQNLKSISVVELWPNLSNKLDFVKRCATTENTAKTNTTTTTTTNNKNSKKNDKSNLKMDDLLSNNVDVNKTKPNQEKYEALINKYKSIHAKSKNDAINVNDLKNKIANKLVTNSYGVRRSDKMKRKAPAPQPTPPLVDRPAVSNINNVVKKPEESRNQETSVNQKEQEQVVRNNTNDRSMFQIEPDPVRQENPIKCIKLEQTLRQDEQNNKDPVKIQTTEQNSIPSKHPVKNVQISTPAEIHEHKPTNTIKNVENQNKNLQNHPIKPDENITKDLPSTSTPIKTSTKTISEPLSSSNLKYSVTNILNKDLHVKDISKKTESSSKVLPKPEEKNNIDEVHENKYDLIKQRKRQPTNYTIDKLFPPENIKNNKRSKSVAKSKPEINVPVIKQSSTSSSSSSNKKIKLNNDEKPLKVSHESADELFDKLIQSDMEAAKEKERILKEKAREEEEKESQYRKRKSSEKSIYEHDAKRYKESSSASSYSSSKYNQNKQELDNKRRRDNSRESYSMRKEEYLSRKASPFTGKLYNAFTSPGKSSGSGKEIPISASGSSLRKESSSSSRRDGPSSRGYSSQHIHDKYKDYRRHSAQNSNACSNSFSRYENGDRSKYNLKEPHPSYSYSEKSSSSSGNNSLNLDTRHDKRKKLNKLSNIRLVDPKMNPNKSNNNSNGYWLESLTPLLQDLQPLPPKVFFHPSCGNK